MLNIVLYQPEIPQNTGNVARTCATIGARLHLIRPFGFRLHDPQFRRAGMDYLEHVELVEHAAWSPFLETVPNRERLFLTSGYATKPYTTVRYERDDYLVFGREADGLPSELLEAFAAVTIPMPGAGRGLNLAVSVGIIAFEAVRQITLASTS
ncbi:MAG: tRNA (cytidine(34)-2'-O)-methyltransferase [Pleurocapsa sp. SU_196_0]|nr:tRNA (cytidine(34)-2'-O)-methyltransferase [Pleurocapsa sp. SU_196_0]